jgi:hypothetical protein
VKVPFFGEALPGGTTAVEGDVTADGKLISSIKKNPGNWYANLHTTTFTDGAVRGQLFPAHRAW